MKQDTGTVYNFAFWNVKAMQRHTWITALNASRMIAFPNLEYVFAILTDGVRIGWCM